MRLNQIREFLAVAEHGSIRAAARALGVTQPALTRGMRLLEQDLGVALLQRNSRGVTTTEAGRAFLARSRAIQAEINRAREEIADLAGRGRTSVGLGVASVIGAALVPPALLRYRKKRPAAQVHIIEGTQETLFPLLREGTIDVAVCLRLESEAMTGLRCRPLQRISFVIACRRNHPLRNARALADLGEASWVTPRPRGPSNILSCAYTDCGLAPPDPAVRSHSLAITLALLATTDMLAIATPEVIASPLCRDLLQTIELDRPMPALTAGIFTRSDSPPTRPVADLAAAIAAAARLDLG